MWCFRFGCSLRRPLLVYIELSVAPQISIRIKQLMCSLYYVLVPCLEKFKRERGKGKAKYFIFRCCRAANRGAPTNSDWLTTVFEF
jgi:hypothetical protein